MSIDEIRELFLSQDWQIEQVRTNAIRCTHERVLNQHTFRRLVSVFAILYVLIIGFVWIRNLVTVSPEQIISWLEDDTITTITRTDADYFFTLADGSEARFTDDDNEFLAQVSDEGLQSEWETRLTVVSTGEETALMQRLMLRSIPAVVLWALILMVLLILFWREADEQHLVIAQQEDGSYRISSLGKRDFVHSIPELTVYANPRDGYTRNNVLLRWLFLATTSLIMTGLIIVITSVLFNT